jgi:uncharacterized protein
VLLEFALSMPFWGLGAPAQARLIPDYVLFRAAWSLTPVMAATILVYRDSNIAGVKASLARILDYSRATSWAWYAPVFLAGPLLVLTQYGIALPSGWRVCPAPLYAPGAFVFRRVLLGCVR